MQVLKVRAINQQNSVPTAIVGCLSLAIFQLTLFLLSTELDAELTRLGTVACVY